MTKSAASAATNAVPSRPRKPKYQLGWTSNIPDELKARPQWVLWRYIFRDGKWTKVPLRADDSPGSTTDPRTWASFDDALGAFRAKSRRFDGIGYVFSPDDPFAGIDFDHCLASGEILDWAADKLATFAPSYAEISPSGNGIKAIVRAVLPGSGTRRNGFGGDKAGAVEMYDRARFFTITGNRTGDSESEVIDRQAEAEALYGEIKKIVGAKADILRPAVAMGGGFSLSDMDLVGKIRTSDQGALFASLWAGDVAGHNGDDSSADLALCNILAFWCGPDASRIDRLFRQSGLFRDKWARDDYRDRTIGKALEGRTEFYSPSIPALQPGVKRSVDQGSVSFDSNGRGQSSGTNGHVEGGSVSFGSDPEGAFRDFEGPPRPIVTELLPVPEFPANLLPEAFRPWAADVAERMQCSLEFVAVGLIWALSVLVGRKVGIRPKQHDSWTVIANLWAMIVGRPGVLKSPALEEAIRPLNRLAAEAREEHAGALAGYEASKLAAEAKKEAARTKLKERARKGASDVDLRILAEEAGRADGETPPTVRRYLANDTTVAKLGEMLVENPNGLGIFRDELLGFLRTLDMEGNKADRAFYLEGWNGTGGFSVDRIGRGSSHIPAVCVSILGGIQPGPLASYVRSATAGVGEDGLIARFQLAVWPDQDRRFRIVDRYPDGPAKEAAYAVFRALDTIVPMEIGAETDGSLYYLRFDHDAQEFFYEWWTALENEKIRKGGEPPEVVNHLSKYRSLMPSLALLFHLADHPEGGPVSLYAARMAAAWCAFLEAHARRIYHAAGGGDMQAARSLAEKLKRPAEARLPEPFSARDVRRKCWSGLSTEEDVDRALSVLEDHAYIRAVDVAPTNKGGRPTTIYHVNPRHKEGGEA